MPILAARKYGDLFSGTLYFWLKYEGSGLFIRYNKRLQVAKLHRGYVIIGLYLFSKAYLLRFFFSLFLRLGICLSRLHNLANACSQG